MTPATDVRQRWPCPSEVCGKQLAQELQSLPVAIMHASVLFVCTGNSCRSVMCEAFARALFPECTFLSAGIDPAKAVKPLAVAVMAEKGIDISSHMPRDLTRDVTSVKVPLDYVVTLCTDACVRCPDFQQAPPYTNTHRVHHSITSPSGLTSQGSSEDEKLAVFRSVRDEIESFIRALPETLPALESV